jgi:UDP-N-acetylglucosamine:LPS N-acetylglucosamine transferase
MCDAAPALARAGHRCSWHLTGGNDLDSVRAAYRQAGIRAEVDRSVRRDRLNAADLVVCRAGATTLAEIAAAGRRRFGFPAHRRTDHQRKNAETLESAGAAEIILRVQDGAELAPNPGASADRDRRIGWQSGAGAGWRCGGSSSIARWRWWRHRAKRAG